MAEGTEKDGCYTCYGLGVIDASDSGVNDFITGCPDCNGDQPEEHAAAGIAAQANARIKDIEAALSELIGHLDGFGIFVSKKKMRQTNS